MDEIRDRHEKLMERFAAGEAPDKQDIVAAFEDRVTLLEEIDRLHNGLDLVSDEIERLEHRLEMVVGR